MKPILISGIQPTGPLHIGNYLGALKNFVALQNSGKYDCFFFVVDLHALTETPPRAALRAHIGNLMIDYLAAGLDPEHSSLCLQSHIPQHAELAWILNTLTPMGELERMTQYKDKTARGIPSNAGLFNYPVLMAADVLLYKTRVVPVGNDQDQHLELARALARIFNKKFGNTFPEPKVLHTPAPRIMSLNDPEKKMSKSAPSGCLFLTDSPAVIKEKIKRAVTDSYAAVGYDPASRPGISNLVTIFSELTGATPQKIVKQFEGRGYAAFKEALATKIAETFAPFRARRKALLAEKSQIAEAFTHGAERARALAALNLAEVKRKMGLL